MHYLGVLTSRLQLFDAYELTMDRAYLISIQCFFPFTATDRTVYLTQDRMDDTNAGWRFCNSACVSDNLKDEWNCDFVKRKANWNICQLRQWIDREVGNAIGKTLK